MNSDVRKFSSEPLPADDWEIRFTKQIVRTIARYRDLRGLTTEQLAARCSEAYGEPGKVKGNTLNGLFAGKRKSIGVAEILIFAQALEVTPIFLMLPIAGGDEVEIQPGEKVHAYEAYRRMVVAQPVLPFISLVDDLEQDHSVIIDAFERHELGLMRLQSAVSVWTTKRKIGEGLPGDWEDALRAQTVDQLQSLSDIRFKLREKGATPPPIPAELAFVDLEPLPKVTLPDDIADAWPAALERK
jgi:transcriptional regulator with XRE-family HTH domain